MTETMTRKRNKISKVSLDLHLWGQNDPRALRTRAVDTLPKQIQSSSYDKDEWGHGFWVAETKVQWG